MRRPAGTGHDDLQTLLAGAPGEGVEPLRRAPDDVYDDADAMREWAARALAAGARAPKPKPKRKNKR